ncbi:GH-E family nuclease [Streptococcus suis]|uniref:GH-E family nuclease n=1 Tax=Streptococcus suis TaxID=1307 RepID=UPI00040B138C|nr:GH-E family nuclease [Streptococcus suis]WAX25609.1 hypothetical protein YS34_GM000078 [Streptococcus phage YS34-rum]
MQAQIQAQREQAVRDEFTQATGIKDAPKSREGKNLLRNWGKALKEMYTHVCKTAKRVKKQVANYVKKIDCATDYGFNLITNGSGSVSSKKSAKADVPKNKPKSGDVAVTKSRQSSTPVQQLALPAPKQQLVLPAPKQQLALPAPEPILALPAPKSTSQTPHTTPLVNGPYIKNGKPNGRPAPTGRAKMEFEQAVYDSQVDPDGILRDPNTQEVIDWKPGQPRKGVVDFGHVKGKSYKTIFEDYKNGLITLDDLKAFQSDPNNFRLETPGANRSHNYE